jgi:thymidylate synthase (FAD)
LKVELIWATPNADNLLAYIARVSNPSNQDNPNIEKLLHYMEREGHVSPFTMANMCVEVNTTRAIGRQMLRHWTLAVQEFSQRYEDVSLLGEFTILEARMQDEKNRQNSLPCDDPAVAAQFEAMQREHIDQSVERYVKALSLGIAKEQARTFLPEGNTPSRLYFNGSIRSWVHYLKVRLHPSTQKEHRVIAEEIKDLLFTVAPVTHSAFFPPK